MNAKISLFVICVEVIILGNLHDCTFKYKKSHPYNLRHDFQFSGLLAKTVIPGNESISYLGPIIWDILPATYKELPSLQVNYRKVFTET